MHFLSRIESPLPVYGAQQVFRAEYPESLKPTAFQKNLDRVSKIFSAVAVPLGIGMAFSGNPGTGLSVSLCGSLHYFYKVVQKVAGFVIIPAQIGNAKRESILEGRRRLIQDFQGTSVTLQTPDNVYIDAMHIPGKKEGKSVAADASTIIFHSGNGTFFELFGNEGLVGELTSYDTGEVVDVKAAAGNIRDFVNRGYNVVLFNYRGVGHSRGIASREGLVLDAESAFQYVHKGLGVPEKNILLFGHSLGGAVSAQVATMHDEVQVCSDRSFSSLKETARSILKKYPRVASLASAAVSFLGWNYDSVEAWSRIKGRKWIVYNPGDSLIKQEASLIQGLRERGFNEVEATALKEFNEIKKELIESKPFGFPDEEKWKEAIEIFAETYMQNAHCRSQLQSEMDEVFSKFAFS